ncbi:MAG: hypothetical protein R6U46_07925 [Marinilabilia sp.]
MEKDALLEIVLHDLKEVETLVQSFKGKTEISPAFLRLTRKRIQSIMEEIDMLEELAEPPSGEDHTRHTPSSSPREEIPVREADRPAKDEPSKTTPPPTPDTEKKTTEQEEEQTPETKVKEEPEAAPRETISAPEKKTETDGTREKEPPATQTDSENTRNQEQAPPQPSPETSKDPEQEETKKEHKVLGEKLTREKSSYNEEIARKATNGAARRFRTSPPIADLRKAMGINDRFYYQRELFGGSAGLMNQTLDQLNEMQSMDDARNFLLTNFNWDPENEAVISFLEIVERRYL